MSLNVNVSHFQFHKHVNSSLTIVPCNNLCSADPKRYIVPEEFFHTRFLKYVTSDNKKVYMWRLIYITQIWKHFHVLIISLRGGVWEHETYFNLAILFYWSVRTKPIKWAIMYLSVRDRADLRQLELSITDCSSAHNNTLLILQRTTLGPHLLRPALVSGIYIYREQHWALTS